MPNITTTVPRLTGNAEQDVKTLSNTLNSLIDEITYLFGNLGAENVVEAASVKAENIDTNKAKINNAQIKSIKADKITSGTIDTNEVTIENKDGQNIKIAGDAIIFKDASGTLRCHIGMIDNKYHFDLLNDNEELTLTLSSDGTAIFKGNITASVVYADEYADSPFMILGNVSTSPTVANLELYNGSSNNPQLIIRGDSIGGDTQDGTGFFAGAAGQAPQLFLHVNRTNKVVSLPAFFKWIFFGSCEFKNYMKVDFDNFYGTNTDGDDYSLSEYIYDVIDDSDFAQYGSELRNYILSVVNGG